MENLSDKDKELLLKDLLARLLYGVRCRYYDCCEGDYVEGTIRGFERQEYMDIDGVCIYIEEIKPYLRPMNSMTGDEMQEIEQMNNHSIQHIGTVGVRFEAFYDTCYNEMYDLFDYLNAHHFDYRGLIRKGLALEAPKGMYN